MKNKILECIYAYICQNNYCGHNDTAADRIYTVTEKVSTDEIDAISGAIAKVGSMELFRIDRNKGVSLDSGEVNPDYRQNSFTYLPNLPLPIPGYEHGGVLSMARLRESLKDVTIRGSKEMSHVLLFGAIPDGRYAVDMLRSEVFKRVEDIKWTEEGSLKGEHYMVCEEKPDRLPGIDWDSFASERLTGRIDQDGLRAVSIFVHALMTAQSEGRKLCVVYKREDYDKFVEYMTVALKLFPPAVANRLSFVTALGKTGDVAIDICGVPTCDKKYIERLENERNAVVITITGLASRPLGSKKGRFASLLAEMSADSFGDWLEAYKRYEPHIGSLSDMDDIAFLYAIGLGKELDETNPGQSLRDVSSAISTVAGKDTFEKIMCIEGELASQIENIGRWLKTVCGAFSKYSVEDIRRYLIDPINDLYQKCLVASRAEEARDVFKWFSWVVFGLSGQSDELREKHYAIFSLCNDHLIKLLGDRYVDFVKLAEERKNDFFDGYLTDQRYVEPAAKCMLHFLRDYYLADFSDVGGERTILRDYYAKRYLEKNLDRFGDILEIVFRSSDGYLNEKTDYLLELVKLGEENEELLQDRIDDFCGRVVSDGQLDSVTEIVKRKYSMQFDREDRVVVGVFEKLLAKYLSAPEGAGMEDLYGIMLKARALAGSSASISVKKKIYPAYFKSAFLPRYKGALEAIRFESFDEASEEKCRGFVGDLKGYVNELTIDDSDVKDAVDAVERFLDDFRVYKEQLECENEILQPRREFVVRDFLLLKAGTIYGMLEKYLGRERLETDRANAGLGKRKMKQKIFRDFAEKEAFDFLNDREAKGRTEFSREVRAERSLIFRGDFRIRAQDFFISLIGAVLFALLMTAAVAIVETVVYYQLANGYFRSVYVLFALLTLGLSFTIYWTNYKSRRLKNILITSVWQTLLFILASVGLFVLTQFLLANLIV